MYISVLPLARSLHPRPYTYSVSELWEGQIVVWGLVEVPIGKYVERGVVASIENEVDENIEIRPIVSVISSTPLLTPTEIAMTEALAVRYLLPVNKVLAFFLPSPLLTRLEKRNYIFEEKGSWRDPKEKWKKMIHQYLDNIYTPVDANNTREEWVVFCFPDDFFLYSFFAKEKEKNILTIPHEATTTRKAQSWIDAREGKYEILVWTRKILYYNLSRYKKLIYVEDAFSAEQYQYPYRIKNLDILRSLADSSDIDITIVSSSPSLELLANFRDFSLVTIKK